MLAIVAALGGAPLEQPPRPNHRKADLPHHRKGGGNRPQSKADAPPRAAPVPASSAPIQHGQRKKHKAASAPRASALVAAQDPDDVPALPTSREFDEAAERKLSDSPARHKQKGGVAAAASAASTASAVAESARAAAATAAEAAAKARATATAAKARAAQARAALSAKAVNQYAPFSNSVAEPDFVAPTRAPVAAQLAASAAPVQPDAAPSAHATAAAAPAEAEVANGQATACQSTVHTVSDDWCETTCKPGQLTGAGCASMCCCDTSCHEAVQMKLQKEVLLEQSDADAEYTGGDGQCHFPQCSKDVCPVDGCQTHWESTCKGPRPAVYVADGHSGSSIITAALANLTGSFVSPWAPYWPELFGDTVQKARQIKSPVKFMAQYFCNGRRLYPLSGLIGFKWKTYSGRYEETPQYDAAWQHLAEHRIPVVWVLRNTLDIIVSDTLHYEQSHDPTVTSFAMTVSRNASRVGSLQLTLAEKLNSMEDAKGKIRRKLKDMGVSSTYSDPNRTLT
jgi:hypothetical protein